VRKVLLCLFLVACGGAQTRGEVTVTPPPATAQPAASGSLLQPKPTCKERLEGTSICFAGGTGTSMKDAIVILGAKGEADGVAAEYKYLEKLYGPKGVGHTVEDQSLMEDGGRSYDRLGVHLKDGRTLDVYFDITDYFGKF
jgi:hypothetical protein